MKVTRTGKWVYGIAQAVMFLGVVVCALVFAGVGWLLLEPREIPMLTGRVEQSLNRPGQPFALTIGKSIVSLGSFQHPLQVTLRDVSLRNLEQQQLVLIPAMHVSLGLFSLISGDVSLGKVTLIEPRLSFVQDKEGVFFLTGEEETPPLALRSFFAGVPAGEPDAGALFDSGVEELEIVAGNLFFSSDITGMKLNIPAANMTIRQYNGLFRGRFDMSALQAGQKDTLLESYFRYDPATQKLFTRLEFKSFTPADYADLMPELSAIEGIKIAMSGTVEMEATLPQTLNRLNVNVSAADGSIRYSPYFPKTIPVSKIELEAAADGGSKTVTLDRFVLRMGKAEVSAKGVWSEDSEKKYTLKGSAHATGINKKIVMQLWPESVSPVTREWVKKSIVSATIPKADFVIDAPAGSLALDELPDEILKTNIQIKEAKVAYVPGFPPAENAEGEVTITGNALKVDVQKAKMLNGAVLTAPGEVSIPSLAAESMEIQLKLPVAAEAADVITFMEATPYKLPESINLTPETIQGNLQGEVTVKIVDHVSPKPDDISFEVVSDITDFSQSAFYKGRDVSTASGKIKATDKALWVDALGEYGQQVLKLKSHLTKDVEHYQIQSTMPADNLKDYGIDVASYVAGNIGVDLDWKESASGGAEMEAHIDLKPSALTIDAIGYLKPEGEEATLSFQGKSQEDSLKMSRFQFRAPARNEEVNGTAEIALDSASLKEVVFETLDFAGSKGKGTYRSLPGGHYLHATGERLDLSFRDVPEPEAGVEEQQPDVAKEEAKDWDLPALDLQLAFDEVQMARDEKKKLQALKLEALCDVKTCQRLELTANAGEAAPFSMKIGHQNGKRILTAYTPRADILLRAMNVFDDMQDGSMQLVGVFQDDLPDHPLVGRLVIGPHRVKNVPMLTKLLTVATFTGIVDMLSGSGLMFQKLEAPFRKVGMNVYLLDAKTAGPSIGITAKGTLDLSRDRLDLRGTVIPAYMFNALIRSIPLLGNVFGALAGDGLVAMRYSMQGDMGDPDVTVNPLSALTPGFLRSFFTIFESDEIKNTQNPKEVQAALEKLEKDLKAIEAGEKPQKPSLPPQEEAPRSEDAMPLQKEASP